MTKAKPIITERIWNGSNLTLDVSQIVGFFKCGPNSREVIFRYSHWDNDRQEFSGVTVPIEEYHTLSRLWIDYFTEYNQEQPWHPGIEEELLTHSPKG